MKSPRKALLLGVLVWLVPFVVAFLVFPLRAAARPLFESIMPVAVALTTVVCGLWYLRGAGETSARAGLLLGILWMAVCLLIDAPLMLLGGPMQMTPAEYLADIGVVYLMIPAITWGLGAARHASR
jgi:hypothetical protein